MNEQELRDALTKEFSRVRSAALVDGAKMMAVAFIDEFEEYKGKKKNELVDMISKMIERCDFILNQ